MTKSARRWVGLVVTVLVLVLVVYHISRSAEWRNFDWHRLAYLLGHARAEYLLLAVLVNYGSNFLRAVRWKFFLEPIKRGSLWNLFVAQIFGFSSIFLIGRPGEIVRPAYIAKRENVSFTSQLAILLLERVYDMIAVALLFAAALDLSAVHATSAHAEAVLRRMHQASMLVLLVTGALVVGLVLFRSYSEALTARLERGSGVLPPKFRSGLGRFLRSLATGLDAIRNWRDLAASVACTVVLWIVNVCTFWLVFHSLGGEMLGVTWWGAAVTVFFAGLGLAVQLPGVGGGFQVGIIEALKRILRVGPEAATSAGILVGIVSMVPIVALGLVLLLYEGISFKHLRAIAKEKRAEAEQAEVKTEV